MTQSDLCMIDGHASPSDLIAGGCGLTLGDSLEFQVRLAVFDQGKVRLDGSPHIHPEIYHLKAYTMPIFREIHTEHQRSRGNTA